MTRSGAIMQANCQHEGEEDWWEEQELGCQEQLKINSQSAPIFFCVHNNDAVCIHTRASEMLKFQSDHVNTEHS